MGGDFSESSIGTDEPPHLQGCVILSEIPSFRVHVGFELAMTIISVFSMFSYTVYRYSRSDWVLGISNAQIGLLYCFLWAAGLFSTMGFYRRIRNKIQENGENHTTLREILLIISPFFSLFFSISGVILSLILRGSQVVLWIFLLYGYALGFFTAKLILKLASTEHWKIVRMPGNKWVILKH